MRGGLESSLFADFRGKMASVAAKSGNWISKYAHFWAGAGKCRKRAEFESLPDVFLLAVNLNCKCWLLVALKKFARYFQALQKLFK